MFFTVFYCSTGFFYLGFLLYLLLLFFKCVCFQFLFFFKVYTRYQEFISALIITAVFSLFSPSGSFFLAANFLVAYEAVSRAHSKLRIRGGALIS